MPKNDSNNSDLFNDVEYIKVSLGGDLLHTFEGSEINGKTKTEFQKLLGEMFGADKFNISQKDKNKFRNKVYFMNGIKLGNAHNEQNFMDSKKLSNSYENIFNQINKQHEGELIRLEKLLHEKYQAEINTVKNELANKLEYIKELEKALDKHELEDRAGIGQLMQLASLFNKGTNQPSNLGDNQNNIEGYNIPKRFLDLFNKIDWVKLSQDDQNRYYSFLEQFINSLPQKGK